MAKQTEPKHENKKKERRRKMRRKIIGKRSYHNHFEYKY